MKRPIAFVTTVMTFFLVLNSCTNSETGSGSNSSFDLAEAKLGIEATNLGFAELVGKSDSVGLSNLYTTDAKLMGANMPPASGRAAIQSAFSQMFSMGPLGLTLTTVDVWGTESLVTEEGVFTLTDGSGNKIDNGKYIVLWKKEDGKWKLFRDIWNSDNAPPASN